MIRGQTRITVSKEDYISTMWYRRLLVVRLKNNNVGTRIETVLYCVKSFNSIVQISVGKCNEKKKEKRKKEIDNNEMCSFNLTKLTLHNDRCMTFSSNYRQQLKQMLHCSVGSGLLTKLYTVTHDVMLMLCYTDDVGCHHSDDNDVTMSGVSLAYRDLLNAVITENNLKSI